MGWWMALQGFLRCQLTLFAECQIIRRGWRKGQQSQSVGGMQDVHLQALQALKTPRSRSREADREAQRHIQKNGTRRQDERENLQTDGNILGHLRFGTQPRWVSVTGFSTICTVKIKNRTHRQGIWGQWFPFLKNRLYHCDHATKCNKLQQKHVPLNGFLSIYWNNKLLHSSFQHKGWWQNWWQHLIFKVPSESIVCHPENSWHDSLQKPQQTFYH